MATSAFSVGLGRAIIEHLASAPDTQLGAHHRQKSAEFLTKEFTARDAFLFLDDIATNSCCESSQFVKTLCSVRNFYVEPTE